jgi:hypothetical protein
MLEMAVEVRKRNRMTWPAAIANAMKLADGSRLLLRWDEQAEEVRVRILPPTFAGALQSVYGANSEEVAAYLAEERAGWGPGDLGDHTR